MAANKGENELDANIDNMIKEFQCPITHDFMVDPVRAEDDHIYERKSIQQWIDIRPVNLTSPMTNELMGSLLVPVSNVRREIISFVNSGFLDKETRMCFNRRQLYVIAEKISSEGNSRAMIILGMRADYDGHTTRSYHWFKHSAKLNNVDGMYMAGIHLLLSGEEKKYEKAYL